MKGEGAGQKIERAPGAEKFMGIGISRPSPRYTSQSAGGTVVAALRAGSPSGPRPRASADMPFLPSPRVSWKAAKPPCA